MKPDLPIRPYSYDDDIIAATRHDGQPRVRVYRLDGTAVVLGRGSDPEKEIVLDACISDRVPLLKRAGGGCAVVLDPGNVIVSLVLPKGGIGNNARLFERLSAWLVEGLRHAGIDGLAREGISDLALEGRKVGGSCIYRPKDLLYYAATLLVEPDLEKSERYLKHPPREPAYRQGRSHSDFMTSLAPAAWKEGAEKLALTLRKTMQAKDAAQAIETVRRLRID